MNGRLKCLWIIIILSIPILGINIACGQTLEAEPTQTPTITVTPSPSSTNTRTATATRTATLNQTATKLADLNQQMKDILLQFELPADSGELGWFQTDSVILYIEGMQYQYDTVAEDFSAGDFVLYTNMTWLTNTAPICAIWFRADGLWPDGDEYILQFLRVSGLPAWDILYINNGYVGSDITEKTRFSSYMNLEDAATNEIILAAIGNEFKVFINGEFEGRYFDYSSKLSTGQFAFSARQDFGTTTCIFTDTLIWVYK